MILQRRAIALIVIFAITYTLSPDAIAAGRTATSASNTILNGKGAPRSSLGIDGDFYIDTRSLLLYGPKRSGKWPTPQSLQGPTGPSGSAGKNGSDGKTVASNVNSSNGAQGPVGPQGEKGEKGEKGETGLPGAIGPAGSAGAMGLPGPAGAIGAAGVNGSNGSNGSNGAQGPTGAPGVAGAKGDTGTVGPSEVTVIDIPEFTLGTSVGYTFIASEQFGNLKSNNSYKFDIFIRANSNVVGMVLGVDLLAAGGILQFSFIRSDSRNSTYSSSPASYGFLITGTIQVSGADSSLVLRVIDGYGDSGANPLTFSGKAYITLVGAIR